MKEKLSSMSAESFNDLSSLISKNLSQLFSDQNVIQKKLIIGAFAPITKKSIREPMLDLLEWEELANLTSYPAYDSELKVMTFKMARMSDLVIKKDFGPEILGPDLKSKEVVPDLILVPGLAFSESGDRLGRGKGFYDKYLEHYRGVKIGVCFGTQVVDEIPTETHDIALDYLVSEQEIKKCIRA